MAGPILAWLVRHEREVAATMRWALQPKDWVRLQLTGEIHTEPSDASATLMYDVVGDTWDKDVVDVLGVDADVLPPVLPSSGSRAGHLTPTAAEFLGLTAGIPVAAGAADTAAAALGSGLVAPGTAQLTIGTGIQIVTPSDQPPAPHLRPRHALLPRRHRRGPLPDGCRPQRWTRPGLGLRDAQRLVGRALLVRSASPEGRRPDLPATPQWRANAVHGPLDARCVDGPDAAAHARRPAEVSAGRCCLRHGGGTGSTVSRRSCRGPPPACRRWDRGARLAPDAG